MIQTLFGSIEREPTLLDKLKSGVESARGPGVTARRRDRRPQESTPIFWTSWNTPSSAPTSVCQPPARFWSAYGGR